MLAPVPAAVQPLYATAVILPSGFIFPVPLFNVAPIDDDVHVIVPPAVVSFTVTVPAVPVTAPPGLMVQVVVVVAVAADAPIPSAKKIAPLLRTEKRPLRMTNPPPDRATSRFGPYHL